MKAETVMSIKLSKQANCNLDNGSMISFRNKRYSSWFFLPYLLTIYLYLLLMSNLFLGLYQFRTPFFTRDYHHKQTKVAGWICTDKTLCPSSISAQVTHTCFMLRIYNQSVSNLSFGPFHISP